MSVVFAPFPNFGLKSDISVRAILDVIAGFFITVMPSQLKKIRAEGQEEAAELAHFLRLAEVWGILAIGSAFCAGSGMHPDSAYLTIFNCGSY